MQRAAQPSTVFASTPSRSRTTSTTRPKRSSSTCCAASGLAGASGMPARGALGREEHLLRPLLGVPRSDIRAYAAEQRLGWIEDESSRRVADAQFHPPARRAAAGGEIPALAREPCARSAPLRHDGTGSRGLLREFLKGKGLRAPSEAKLLGDVEAVGFGKRRHRARRNGLARLPGRRSFTEKEKTRRPFQTADLEGRGPS